MRDGIQATEPEEKGSCERAPRETDSCDKRSGDSRSGESGRALGGVVLCAAALFALWAPALLGGGLPGTASPSAGGSGPLAWAASMAVGVGALWARGIGFAGWEGPRRWAGAALAVLLPLGVLASGWMELKSGPLPLGLLPDAAGGAAALGGLLAFGVFLGLGRWGGSAPVFAVAAAALLDGAPGGWGLFTSTAGGAPWDAAATAWLLDFSPRTFVMESGGVDWMRHPEVYASAGTDRIGPALRAGWTGSTWPLVVAALGGGLALWQSVRAANRGTGFPIDD